jgi:hypothetical protein
MKQRPVEFSSLDDSSTSESTKNKISTYLPVALVEDLSFSESLSSEELDENETLPKPNNKQQIRFKRRRSSSHDFLKSMTLISMFTNKKNEMIPERIINKVKLFNNNTPSYTNNDEQDNRGGCQHTQHASNIRNSNNKQQKQTKNKRVVKFQETTPITNNNNNAYRLYATNANSHSSTSITSLNQMENYNLHNNIHNDNSIVVLKQQNNNNKEFRTHTSKSAPREFIDPDLLNPNQTFQEFLVHSKHKLSVIIKTSIGSRFLQKMLTKITPKDITQLFHILNTELPSLICDNYGNYFFQKIILKCSLEQRLFLYDALRLHYAHIANDISGTHCLQSLIEKLSDAQEEEIIKNNIIDNLFTLSCGVNSTHVIQKLLGKIPEMKRTYINTFILDNFVPLCKDVNGICVVKKFLSENKNEVIAAHIVNALEKNCYEITRDQFGNYAMQHALDKYSYSKVCGVIRIICNDVVCFSNQKFSSNVVDKIMLVLYQHNRGEFNSVMKEIFMKEEKLLEIAKNKFGMFVLMNVWKLIAEEDKEIIRKYLITQLGMSNEEKQSVYGKILKNFA